MTRNDETARGQRRVRAMSPLQVVVRDWPWEAAAAVGDPELAYWLGRAEATWRLYPELSNDLLRATQVEISAVVGCSDRIARRAAQVLGGIATLVPMLYVWKAAGMTRQLLAVLPSPLPLKVAAVSLIGVTLLATCRRVGRWIDHRLSHRAVLARDRLNRWLVPWQLPDLITMNYHKLNKWQHELKAVVKTVIFDEVQELRRKDSDKYTAARAVASNAKYVIGLSGTPIYNYGAEAYYLIDAIKPGALGTEEEFARQWCGTTSLGPKSLLTDPGALHAHLQAQGLMHRCDYEAAGIPKPKCNPIQQFVPSDPEILEQLQGNAVEMARLIVDQATNPKERFRLAILHDGAVAA